MAIYVIGDLQGCLTPLRRLLDDIGPSSDDRLWLLRGAVLKLVRATSSED